MVLLLIELAGAAAPHHQIAVALLEQPCQVGLGGDARVHDHQGAMRRAEPIEHHWQRSAFRNVAGKRLGAAHKAAAVEYQAQCQQRTIAALLLRAPPFGLGIALCLALEIGIGQVI